MALVWTLVVVLVAMTMALEPCALVASWIHALDNHWGYLGAFALGVLSYWLAQTTLTAIFIRLEKTVGDELGAPLIKALNRAHRAERPLIYSLNRIETQLSELTTLYKARVASYTPEVLHCLPVFQPGPGKCVNFDEWGVSITYAGSEVKCRFWNGKPTLGVFSGGGVCQFVAPSTQGTVVCDKGEEKIVSGDVLTVFTQLVEQVEKHREKHREKHGPVEKKHSPVAEKNVS